MYQSRPNFNPERVETDRSDDIRIRIIDKNFDDIAMSITRNSKSIDELTSKLTKIEFQLLATAVHRNLLELVTDAFGNPVDDHTQYLYLAGRAGGQDAIGGTAANETLSLQSTSNATRGYIDCIDDVGVATAAAPNARLEIEDGATAHGVIVKITADDATPWGLVIGNDTASTTDTHGIQMKVSNTGVGFIETDGTAGTEPLTLQSNGNDLFSYGPVGINTLVGAVSWLEVWDSAAHPIITITGAHATDYDPQIQFRTDFPETVKCSIGVDSANDSFVIAPGAGGVGGDTSFVFNADGLGIGTSTIPHAGVGIGKFAYDGLSANANGPHMQFTLSDLDNYPALQITPFAHDYVQITFDAYINNALSWISSDAGSSFQISKESDTLRFNYDVAAAGAAVTWNVGISLDTTGNVVVENGDLSIHSDNKSLLLGAAGDAEIVYTGTHMEFNHLVGTGDFVFNNAGNDNDFRVEGTVDANVFFIDASANRIAMGHNAPTYRLDVLAYGDDNHAFCAEVTGNTGNARGFKLTATGTMIPALLTEANWTASAIGKCMEQRITAKQDSGAITIYGTYCYYITDDASATESGYLLYQTKTNGTLFDDIKIGDGGNVALPRDDEYLLFGAGEDMGVYYDGANGVIDTSLVAASDLIIDCGANKTVVLDEVVWDDYVTPLGPNNWRGVSNNPVLTQLFTDGAGSQGVYAYVFTNDDEALITIQMPHRWKEGTTIYPHIHFMCTSDVDPSDNFGVEFEWAWADVGEDFPANSTLETNDIATGVNTDNMHQIGNVTSAGIDGTGHTISSILLCRIKRVAATSDDYADGVAFLDFDVHYEIDTIGSRQILTK